MATVRTPRSTWIDAALEAVAAGGPGAVRVEALARTLGVTKGGFYWHFTDRKALIDEMLDAWQKAGTEDIIAHVDSQPTDARAKLRRLYKLTASGDGLAAELAIREWSRYDKDIAERLRRVDNRRMQYLRSLFSEFCADESDVEARSMLAYSLLIGNYFIAAKHGGRSRTQVLRLAIDRLLSESWH
jgi:AcrR family transcriptional regulator